MPAPSDQPSGEITGSSSIQVAKIAHLARIRLDADQVAQAQSEMERILEYVRKLDELDLTAVEPFFGAASRNHGRADSVTGSLSQQQALANAPSTDGQYYLVPPVMADPKNKSAD